MPYKSLKQSRPCLIVRRYSPRPVKYIVSVICVVRQNDIRTSFLKFLTKRKPFGFVEKAKIDILCTIIDGSYFAIYISQTPLQQKSKNNRLSKFAALRSAYWTPNQFLERLGLT